MLTVALIKVCNALDAIIPLVVMSPQDTEELRVEFTHEELFQFYSQVRTNENRLSCSHVCTYVCVRTYNVRLLNSVCTCVTCMIHVQSALHVHMVQFTAHSSL